MALNKRLFTQEGGVTNTENFNTVTYTGNGSTQSITGVGFQPDFIWIKERNSTGGHVLVDSVRGRDGVLYSNSTSTEAPSPTGRDITSFDSDGFSLGTNNNGNVNTSSNTYVAWCWKAGGTAVSNTDGSVTSSVSANTEAGFSIANFTTPTTNNFSVGHGLDSAPELVFYKGINITSSWTTYAQPKGATKYLLLNTTAGANTSALPFNDTAPTSSVLNLGSSSTWYGQSKQWIAYSFHSVDGLQKIGSYTGNGNSNGPTVTTGFQPRFVMVKLAHTGYTARDWHIWDTARDTNLTGNDLTLSPNTTAADLDGQNTINILSDGFKIANPFAPTNTNGGDFIYLAIA